MDSRVNCPLFSGPAAAQILLLLFSSRLYPRLNLLNVKHTLYTFKSHRPISRCPSDLPAPIRMSPVSPSVTPRCQEDFVCFSRRVPSNSPYHQIFGSVVRNHPATHTLPESGCKVLHRYGGREEIVGERSNTKCPLPHRNMGSVEVLLSFRRWDCPFETSSMTGINP
ncbi:hypothetical protein PM082_013776 [Marasmius tenuissimus]|nr:hypothetical protein PM082_013776 [Marasmius tenuissimus]